MGIGTPVEILEGIERGVDMFDSRMPTQNARRGSLFTSIGKIRILGETYKTDKSPIDKNCDCFACQNYTPCALQADKRRMRPISPFTFHPSAFNGLIIQYGVCNKKVKHAPV